MYKPKIICSDFDGTLKQKDPSILQHNLDAIQAWRQAGNIFIIITGRNHAVLDEILPNWQNLIDYVITDNGGAIFSNHDEILCTNELRYPLIRQIRSLVCDRAVPLTYSPYRCSIELLASETAIKLRLWFRTERFFQIYQEQIANQDWPIKILPWIGAGFSKLPSGASTNQFFGFLDIVPSNSGKECAITQLANLKNWEANPADIITIGDDYNDIAMLEAFQGYAISNSPQEVITAAQSRIIPRVADLIHDHL